jgi:hypothetical protein
MARPCKQWNVAENQRERYMVLVGVGEGEKNQERGG